MNQSKVEKLKEHIESLPEPDPNSTMLPPLNEIQEQNSLMWWFPKLQAIDSDGIHLPKTHVIHSANIREICNIFDGKKSETLPSLVAEIVDVVAKELEFSWPIFMRTDYTSHKHSWKDTCFVTDPDKVEQCVVNLMEQTMMAIGLPLQTFVLREYIPMHTIFEAFHGNMPINREFRFFVERGKVIHTQPYWPAAAIENKVAESLYPNWREELHEMSLMTEEQHKELSRLAILAGNAMGSENPWSVDFSMDRYGKWWLIDMARGEVSYIWKPDFEVVL